MKFKVDENLPVEVTRRLKESAHDAFSVLDQNLGGTHDANLADICRQEQRVLITLDLDFADIRSYPPAEHSGIIVLRLERQDRLHVLGVVERFLRALDDEAVDHCLWIVDEHRIRIRQ